MIVVDTNILACLYLPGPWVAAAESLFEQDSDWAAPSLWRSEFRSILSGCLRRGDVSFEQACALQREAESLMAETTFVVDALSVFEHVAHNDCSAYDCEFVALAHQLGTRLFTMDKKILRAFPDRAVPLTLLP